MSIASTDFVARHKRLLTKMEERGLDTVLVYGNPRKPDYLYYLTGFRVLGTGGVAVFRRDAEPVLYLGEAWDLARAKSAVWFELVGAAKDLAESAHVAAGSKKAAVAGREVMPWPLAQYLAKALGAPLQDANPLLQEMARAKSPEEVALVREAARLADAGFMAAVEFARPGIKEFELVSEIEYAMQKEGASDNFMLLASQAHNHGMVVPREKPLAEGDVVIFEITPSVFVNTYAAQLCKTIVIGAMSPLVEEKYQLLREALETSLSLIKPGVRLWEVAACQNEIFTAAGYGQYCGPPYMRTRGHGFGILQDLNIEEGVDVAFEVGTTVVVHPNQYLPETGYLALGEMIAVTGDGVERLSRTEPRIYQHR